MGEPKTAEHRAKISAALTGRVRSEAERASMSRAMKARWANPEEAQRMSSAMRGRVLVPDEDWTPLHSRSTVHNAVKRGLIPPASHCAMDPTHEGPFHYDHCGDPPYARENRLVVQPLCSVCHVALSATRRAGAGYRSRKVTGERACSYCGELFVVANSKRLTQERVFCCREHYLRGR